MEPSFGGDKDYMENQGEQANKEFNDGVGSEGGLDWPVFPCDERGAYRQTSQKYRENQGLSIGCVAKN